MVVFNIISYQLIAVLFAFLLWPYLGAAALLSVFIAAAFMVYAWMNADTIVAGKAGFRRPTIVQQRYLDYLGIDQEVITHPSSSAVVGALASSRNRMILLTTGVFKLYESKDLSENDMRRLIAELASDDRPVFGWTFHLATGAAGLFSRSDRDDPSASWGRRTIFTGLAGGLTVLILGFLIAAAVSPLFGRPIDISSSVPILWLPFIYLAARFVWRRGNAALIRPAAGEWNTPITLEQVTFAPMLPGKVNHPNLDLLRDGLLISEKRRTNSGEENY